MVVERPSPEQRRRDQAWYLTLHANNELSYTPLKVFGRLGVLSWCVGSSCFPGIVSWAYEREQTWSLFECLAELWEFACGIGRKRCSSRPSHNIVHK